MMILLKKLLLNLKLDLHWISSGEGSIVRRTSYLFSKYRAILADLNEIGFLGKSLKYDNRLTPALLTDYYFELQELSKTIDFDKIKTVFDIGANVGQFSATLKYFNPQASIYSFEPNPIPFSLLQQNCRQYKSWICLPFGVGHADSQIPFYFVEGKSGQGSVHKENASEGLMKTDLTQISVAVRTLDSKTREEFTLPEEVDLIKIDVEGAEKEVLLGLRDVRWKYLYMEACESRSGGISVHEIMKILNSERERPAKIKSQSTPATRGGTIHLVFES